MTTAILRRPAVQAETGKPRSTLYDEISTGLFPHPIRIGARSVGWPASDVVAVNAARIAGASDNEIRALVAKLEAARKAVRKGGQS